MESVQILMAVEEAFKIELSSDEVAQSDTVGKMVDAVHARLRHSAEDPCLSQQGFYIVRKALMEQFGLERSSVNPESVLDTLIPKEGRPAIWEAFMRKFTNDQYYGGAALVRPKKLDRIIQLLLPCCAFLLSLVWLPYSLFWLGFFPALFVLIVGNRATARWKTFFPPTYTHVKDLVPFVKTLDTRTWTKDEVFEKVREITVNILGVKPEEVKRESRWFDNMVVD